MQIKEIRNSKDKARYNELAKDIGNIFNTLEWLKIFKSKVKIFGVYENDGNLIGGFCLCKERKFSLNTYRNPLFTPCIGPFLRIEAKNPTSIMTKWKEVIGLMAKTIDGLSYSVVSISLNKDVIDVQPFIWRKFKVIPNYTYVIDLDKPIENIYKRMSKERKNDIAKAVKDRLIVKQVDDFEIVKSLVLKTFLRQKKSINKFYLDKILFELANANNSFAFIIFKNSKPIITAFCIYDKKTAYYLLGGYDYKLKHRGAGALAIWEAIKHAKKLGLKYFDLEGSMISQIEKYFREFGGRLVPYYRVNKAKLVFEIILKLFKRELF